MDDPVARVEITVVFAGQTYSGTTDAEGVFRTDWIKNLAGGTYVANVVNLDLPGFNWNALTYRVGKSRIARRRCSKVFDKTKPVALLLVLFVALAAMVRRAAADTFGGGENTFDIEFVTIGNPGNHPDTTGEPIPAGAVPYTYRIGTYEVSEDMVNKAKSEGGLPYFDQSPWTKLSRNEHVLARSRQFCQLAQHKHRKSSGIQV